MTLEQIGAILGVTRERARQISEAALEKIRQRYGIETPKKTPRVGPVSVAAAAAEYQTSKDAAASLGILVTTFERRCKKLGIEPPSARKHLVEEVKTT